MKEAPAVKTLFAAAAGVGIGAALMYVFDPEHGRRRRAIARDKALGAANDSIDAVEDKSRDLSNRARGAVAEARGVLAPERPELD